MPVSFIVAVLLFIAFGFAFPRFVGWGIIVSVPLLGLSNFVLIPSNTVMFDVMRAASAATIGIFIRFHMRGFSFKALFRDKLFVLVIIFNFWVLLLSLNYNPGYHLFSALPNSIFPFIVCYIIIKDEKDLHTFLKIMAWVCAILSLSVIVAHFTQFDISNIFRLTNPRNVELESHVRSGLYRARGLYGNAVATSYAIVALLPISIWYGLKTRFFGAFLLVVVIAGIFLSQTRAAMLVMTIVLLSSIFMTKSKGAPIWALVLLCMYLLISNSSELGYISEKMYHGTITGLFHNMQGRIADIASKMDRIPVAFEHFLKEPIFGYGSPRYAYSVVMRTADLPAPMIYLLAGGFFLFLVYMSMIWSFPIKIYKIYKNGNLTNKQRVLVFHGFLVMLASVMVVHSNLVEGHFTLMFMIYTTIYKVYVYDKRKSLKVT